MPIPPPPVSSPAAPVEPDERLLALDVLRGMALLGVVVANVCFWFSGLFLRYAEFRPQVARLTLDSVAFHAVGLFVSGRAIAIFSFLFGVGLAVQMRRAEARGADVAPLYRRRMAVLLALGITHGVLVWYGDILTVYALLGLALLLFRRRGDRTLFVWAGVMLVAVPVGLSVLMMLAGGGSGPSATAAAAARSAETLAAFRSLNPARIAGENLHWLRQVYLGPAALGTFPPVFGCFLLGLWAGRLRLLEGVPARAAAFRRVAAWGLGIGLAAGVASQLWRIDAVLRPERPAWGPLFFSALQVLAVYPMAAGYVSLTTLLLERPAWRRRLAVFAPVGRMALTNYLAQSVICVLVFYGGGLVGSVGVAASVGIAVAVFAVQAAWSPWWLARYRFGPVEWLWRSLAYGRPQPMRIQAPAARPGLAV